MKKHTRLLSAVFALLLAFSVLAVPGTALRAEAASSYVVTITGSTVNVRKGAGTNYSKVSAVKKGSKYDWLADGKDSSGRVWYKIKLSSSKTGWVTSQYAKKSAAVKSDYIVKVTGSKVNVRTGAGTKYSKVATASKNATYKYLSQAKDSSGRVWYKIQYSASKTAWITSQYSQLVSVKPTETTTTATTTESSEPQTTTSETSETDTPTSGSTSGSTTASTTESTTKSTTSTTKAPATVTIVTVTGSTVNIRSGAGTNYSKVGSAKKGKQFPYLSSKKDSSGRVWYKIQYTSKTTGWITSQYSKKSTVTENTDVGGSTAYNNVQKQINSAASSHGTVGIQVAAIRGSDGKIFTWNKGYATKGKTLVGADTKYRVASISKVAIAINAMKMQEQGILNVETKIGTYWGKTLPKAVTLRSLLTHTSTLKSLSYKSSKADTLSQLKASGNYTSGTVGSSSAWRYNNYGAGIAGSTLEVASKKKLDVYSKENVFWPLDMDASFMSGTLKDTSKLATLYYADDTVSRSVATSKGRTGGSIGCNTNYFAGGLTASAKDVAKLFAMLANDGTYNGKQILTPESVATIEKVRFNKSENGGTFGQAMPLRYKAGYLGQSKLYYHTGNAYGVLALASYNPDTGDTVVVVTTGAAAGRDSQGVYKVCSSIAKSAYSNLKNC